MDQWTKWTTPARPYCSVSFGGGLVAGDRSGMSVSVADDCTAVLATQGTTKVYKHAKHHHRFAATVAATAAATVAATAAATVAAVTAAGSAYSASDEKTSRDTVQGLAARVGDGALLAVIPDPAGPIVYSHHHMYAPP